MLSFTIRILLWPTLLVLAPPSFTISNNDTLETEVSTIETSSIFSTHSEMLIAQPTKIVSQTRTSTNYSYFDITSYRSSWMFIDKNTVRIRFRLYKSLIRSIILVRFVARHIRTNNIQTYTEDYELINSTLTLYLHELKHGRHSVCAFIYTSKLMNTPRHVLCQDIIFNFHKYGHVDTDSDEYGNTFVFLLTQYSIVIGMLCILQVVYVVRKRRVLRTVYQKANSLRNFLAENYHHLEVNKSTTDLRSQSHALECLIYRLNRGALDHLKNTDMTLIDENDINHPLERRHVDRVRRKVVSFSKSENDISDSDENELDHSFYEEKKRSIQSLSHILEANKPWITKLNENGDIEHSILTSKTV